MNKRIIEILFVLTLVSFTVQYFHQKKEHKTVVESPPTQQVQSAPRPPKVISIGDSVPNFMLTNSHGELVQYNQGDGSLFISLTATGCGDCLRRIEAEDVTAFEMAKKSQLQVWNMLVYHPNSAAADFVNRHHPSADQVLADPQSEISVKTLGGSDSTCWLLIDGKGRLAYRGPADPAKLEIALQKL